MKYPTRRPRSRCEDIDMDLKYNAKWGCVMVYSDPEQGLVTGSYEHNNALSGPMKGREYIDQLRESFFLRKTLLYGVNKI
jgi:hypothetical protein